MAIQKILTVPNPLLHQKSKPVNLLVSKKVKKIIQDLLETVKNASEPAGLGLSAIQIGKPVRIFVAKIGKKFEVFINPKIIAHSKETLTQILKKDQLFFEGCLSLPGIYGFVDRPYQVKIEWQDLQGKKHFKKLVNKESVCVQHELDHLNGILFTQRILKQKGKIYQLKKQKGKEVFEEFTIK